MIDDLDIEVLNPDYKQTQMIIQIRKIVDSIGNPNPLHWVRTESGRKCWIAHKHAKTIVKIYDALTSEESQSYVVQNRQRPEVILSHVFRGVRVRGGGCGPVRWQSGRCLRARRPDRAHGNLGRGWLAGYRYATCRNRR